MPIPASPGDQYVQSLARGLSVITAFDAENPQMTLSEVAERTGLSRATARRFLHTLVELGFVGSDGRLFTLTPQVLQLGTAYLSGLRLPQVAQPHLEALSVMLGESTSAAVLDRTSIVYVARVAARRIMSVNIELGTQFPAFATSMGRVLLAHLEPDDLAAYFDVADLTAPTPQALDSEARIRDELEVVRAQGWAVVDQELERGLRSIAVPVLDHRGVVAAINVSAQAIGSAQELVRSSLTQLKTAADDITLDLKAVARQR